jgi:hypothetical protein
MDAASCEDLPIRAIAQMVSAAVATHSAKFEVVVLNGPALVRIPVWTIRRMVRSSAR